MESGYTGGGANATAMPMAGSKDMSEKELVAELVRRRIEQDKRQRDAVTSLTLANKVRDLFVYLLPIYAPPVDNVTSFNHQGGRPVCGSHCHARPGLGS